MDGIEDRMIEDERFLYVFVWHKIELTWICATFRNVCQISVWLSK